MILDIDVLSKIIKECSHIDCQLSYSDTFESIGIDSVSFIKMIAYIESTFEIEFDIEYLNIKKFVTVRDFADYVENRKSSQ